MMIEDFPKQTSSDDLKSLKRSYQLHLPIKLYNTQPDSFLKILSAL